MDIKDSNAIGSTNNWQTKPWCLLQRRLTILSSKIQVTFVHTWRVANEMTTLLAESGVDRRDLFRLFFSSMLFELKFLFGEV